MEETLESGKISGSGSSQPETLGAWLEQQCRAENLSYRQAAARAGVSHATIAAIKNGARPSAATIVKLADAFSSNGTHQRQALKDRLLSLSGYRGESANGELSEPLARLMDRLSGFSEAQLRVMERFADFISETEVK